MARSLRNVLALGICLMLVLSGCAGGGSPKDKDLGASSSSTGSTGSSGSGGSSGSSGTATAPVKVENVTIAVGGKSSIMYLPPALAEYNGYFKEESINLKVEDLKGGSQAAQALVSGQVDFASMAVEHAVKSKAQGVDLVMLSLYTQYPAITLIVDSKLQNQVKTVADLKGMRVGVTSPGSATHKAMLSLLDKFGLPADAVEIVGVGTNSMPAAIESGQVQAAFGLDPWVTQMVSSGKTYILWDLRTKKDTEELFGGPYPLVGLVTRQDVIDKNPELVQRVVRAVVKGNHFLAKNSPEAITAKLPVDIKGEDEALYLASLRANLEAFSPDGVASTLGIQLVIESLKKDKVIPETADISPHMVFDDSWIRKGL